MQLSMKIYVPLLWGVCVWFAVESMTTSIPESRSTNVTAEAKNTTGKPTTAEDLQTARWNLMLTSKGVSAAAEKTASQKQTTEKSDGIVVTTAAAATNSSKVPAPMKDLITRGVAKVSTLGTAITSEAQPSPAVTMTTTEVQPSPLVTTTTTEVQPSPVVTTTTTEVQPSPAVTTTTTEVQPSPAVTTTTTEVQPSPAVTTTTTKVQPSPAVTTATDETRSPHYTTDTLSHTSSQPHHSSASIFTEKPTPTTVSSQQPTYITGVTSEIPSTTSLKKATQNVSRFIQDISSPTPSSPTSEEATIKLSSTSQSVPKSSTLKSTTSEIDAATDSPSSTTFNSTSAGGILIPKKPKRLLITTTKPAPAAITTPCETSKKSPSSEFQPCSTRGIAKQCLIIIAILAVLATVFMISTIVLCVKLSARRPKVKKQQGTEMMCISALLPERTPTYTRHRTPVSNGVLVLPGFADSDEEGGDNVTLSSFLPDNDRYL